MSTSKLGNDTLFRIYGKVFYAKSEILRQHCRYFRRLLDDADKDPHGVGDGAKIKYKLSVKFGPHRLLHDMETVVRVDRSVVSTSCYLVKIPRKIY
jgi:hypothetical protein